MSLGCWGGLAPSRLKFVSAAVFATNALQSVADNSIITFEEVDDMDQSPLAFDHATEGMYASHQSLVKFFSIHNSHLNDHVYPSFC